MNIHASSNSMDIHWNPLTSLWGVSPPQSVGVAYNPVPGLCFVGGDMRGICAGYAQPVLWDPLIVLELGLYKGSPPPSVGNLCKYIVMDTFFG